MNLAEEFLSFNENRRAAVHFCLCTHALEILFEYFAAAGNITYVESVVGTWQKVDRKLPSKAFYAARAGQDHGEVIAGFAEPAALQGSEPDFSRSPRIRFLFN